MISQPQTFQQLFQSIGRLDISLVWGVMAAGATVTGFIIHLYLRVNKTLTQTVETHTYTQKMATNELPHIQQATEKTATAVEELVGISRETLTILNKVADSMDTNTLMVAKLQGFMEGQTRNKDTEN